MTSGPAGDDADAEDRRHPVVPAEAGALLDRIVPALRRELGDEVVGIYLWGSATLGGWRDGLSDVDLLVCLRADPTEQTLTGLTTVHTAVAVDLPEWIDRVEVAYAGIDSLQQFRTVPHRIARISPGEPLNLRMADDAWLIDWFQVREHGRALVGPPPRDVLPAIAIDELRAEAVRQVRAWADRVPAEAAAPYLAYVVLAIARGLHVARTGVQASKQAAGAWIADEFPDWRGLAQAAVAQQASSDSITDVDIAPGDVAAYAQWAASLVT